MSNIWVFSVFLSIIRASRSETCSAFNVNQNPNTDWEKLGFSFWLGENVFATFPLCLCFPTGTVTQFCLYWASEKVGMWISRSHTHKLSGKLSSNYALTWRLRVKRSRKWKLRNVQADGKLTVLLQFAVAELKRWRVSHANLEDAKLFLIQFFSNEFISCHTAWL